MRRHQTSNHCTSAVSPHYIATRPELQCPCLLQMCPWDIYNCVTSQDNLLGFFYSYTSKILWANAPHWLIIYNVLQHISFFFFLYKTAVQAQFAMQWHVLDGREGEWERRQRIVMPL